AAAAPYECAAEERDLEEILLVEPVLDVDLGPEDCPADGERVPGARVQNEARRHLDRLVEVEQAGPVRRIGVRAVRESTSIDAGRREVEAMGGIHHARDARQPLVVVEVERSRRRHGGEEPAGDRAVPVRVVQGQVHVRRYRPARPYLDDALDAGDAHLVDVHRRHDYDTGPGAAVEPTRNALVLRRQIGHDAAGATMYVPGLVE